MLKNIEKIDISEKFRKFSRNSVEQILEKFRNFDEKFPERNLELFCC